LSTCRPASDRRRPLVRLRWFLAACVRRRSNGAVQGKFQSVLIRSWTFPRWAIRNTLSATGHEIMHASAIQAGKERACYDPAHTPIHSKNDWPNRSRASKKRRLAPTRPSKSLRNTPTTSARLSRSCASPSIKGRLFGGFIGRTDRRWIFPRWAIQNTLSGTGHEMMHHHRTVFGCHRWRRVLHAPAGAKQERSAHVAIPLTPAHVPGKIGRTEVAPRKKGSHARTRAGADDVLQKVRQIDTAASITDWLNSPALQSQK